METNNDTRYRRKINQALNVLLDTAFALSDKQVTVAALKRVQKEIEVAIYDCQKEIAPPTPPRTYVIQVPSKGYYVKETQSWTQDITEASRYSEETFGKYHDHTGSVDARWVLVS
jgi:uncharacterized membrane-anchored protein